MIKDVRQLLNTLYEKGKRKDLVTVRSTLLVKEAAAVMAQEHINLLVVKDGGAYLGVVTTVDTSGDLGTSLRPSENWVSRVMTKAEDVVTVSLGDDLMGLPLKFKLHKIRHLVVVENEKWIAILDTNEVLEAVMANITEEEQQKSQYNSEFRQ